MEHLKLFVTGQTPMANNIALFTSIGLATYCHYKCNKHEEMLALESTEEEFKPTMKMCMKKHMMWGVVVLFMIPIIIGAMNKSSNEPSSSFQARVSAAAESLRDTTTTSEDDFKARVAQAAADLKAQIASSSAALPEMESPTQDSTSDLATKAGEEIKKFLNENS